MTSLPYILFSLMLGALALTQYSADSALTRKRIEVGTIVLYFLFFGLRGFIFSDWQVYYPVFEECDLQRVTWIPGKTWSYEPGFTLLLLVCKNIWNNWFFFSVVCSLINLALLYRFFRKRITYLPLGLMIYLITGGIFLSTDLMRNSIAIFLFINSLEYLEQRRPLPYFLLCLLALSFHISSIFYFPLYFFLHKKCNKWLYLAVFLAGNAILLLHLPLMGTLLDRLVGGYSDLLVGDKLDAYAGMDSLGGVRLSIGFLERIFTGMMIFLYIDKLVQIRKENVIFINAMLLYIVITFLFSDFEILYKRVSNLFSFAYWILWYDLIRCFAYKGNKWLFISFIGLYCVLKIHGNTRTGEARYENILFDHSTYTERQFYMDRLPPATK